MLLVRILDQFGFSQTIGEFIGPAMAYVGLPPEAGIVWTVAILVGTYAGVGAIIAFMPVMDLDVGQMSILTSMILCAHMVPSEQAIVHRAGASFFWTSVIRIASAIIFAFIANLIIQHLGILQDTVNLSWTPDGLASDDWLSWSIATLQTMLLMLCIIFILFLVLDIFERIGVNRLLTILLSPLHKILGIRKELAPLTSVGLLLGLGFGSGLIIEYVERNQVSKRELFVTLSFLSIFHAIIEDTLLMLALGADIWVILVWRGVFAVVFMALLARIMMLWPQPAQKAA